MRVVLGRGLGLLVVASLVSWTSACSDDEESPAPMDDAGLDSGPPEGGSDAGGTGGSGGSGGTGGTGGTDAAVPGPVTFMCESTMCTVPDLGFGAIDPALLGGLGMAVPDAGNVADLGLTGCCVDGNVCGVESTGLLNGLGCVEQNQAGTPDTGCPTIMATLSMFGFTITNELPGCCQTESGMCGVDLSNVGLDFGDLGPLAGLVGGLLPMSIDLGPGCLELSQAQMIMNEGMMVLTDAGTTEPIACGPGAGDGGTDDGGT